MKIIVVAGDVSVDWLVAPVPSSPASADAAKPTPNWQLTAGYHYVSQEGGALLIAKFLANALDKSTKIFKPDLPQPLESVAPSVAVHSVIGLRPIELDKRHQVFRADRLDGFCGPVGNGSPPAHPVSKDDVKAGLLVLDDAGNGFRADPSAWPAALTAEKTGSPAVILKTHRPLWPNGANPLAEKLFAEHLDRLVVIISADDLRAEGVKISRRLSWERTAYDFCTQIASRHNGVLRKLHECQHLIVRLGVDAALYYRYDPECRAPKTTLIFDPTVLEGGFCDEHKGLMIGYGSAFTAVIAQTIVQRGLDDLTDAIGKGIQASRQLLIDGFGSELTKIDYPTLDALLHPSTEARRIVTTEIPEVRKLKADWSILYSSQGRALDDIAYDIVRTGSSESLADVPRGKFGDLETIDRTEIESFQTIRNLIREYLALPKAKAPLSIAVFGPPGSGKSFGVEQVTKSVASGRFEVEKLDFNVSQFTTVRDLIDAFHKIRDATLQGKTPLVFFDEFDAEFDGRSLGWLKFFLAPMQDGKFKEGESMRPIGKALFVFAGGTSNTYAEFAHEATAPSSGGDNLHKAFRDAKGPDFVSRLRGYVNVLGPNPTNEYDHFAMLRRAMLLRSLLKRKAPRLIDSTTGMARIDDSVLRALIKVSTYKHGIRSIEATIDMSLLREGFGFEQASLPPEEQLMLHVDCKSFTLLLSRDAVMGAARERLAQAFHEQYLFDQTGRKPPSDPAMMSWNVLREDLKEANRAAADDIPRKLAAIHCTFAVSDGQASPVAKFTYGEVEKLAELEHERWCSERLSKGWRQADTKKGEKRDDSRFIHDQLVSWDELTDDSKEYDREQVRALPRLMQSAGFVIVKKK